MVINARIKPGSIVRFAGEDFVVDCQPDRDLVGVFLSNGLYCEIPIEKLEPRK